MLGRIRARVTRPGLLRRVLLAVVALLLVSLLLETVSPFRQLQLAQAAYLAIAAGGLTLLIGLNGQLSLGHGALMAIGAYTAALLQQDGTRPILLVLIAAVLAATVAGAVIGVAAARLHGPYLAGSTLALAVAVPGVASHYSSVLGGEQGLRVPTAEVPAWGDTLVFALTGTETRPTEWVAYVAGTLLVLTYLLLANLSSGRVGRRWRAVRDDPVAAELAGIDLARARVAAFVVSAACAGLAGGLMAAVTRIAAPSGFTLVLSLTLLSAVVLGGLGSLAGALIGAAALTVLPQVVTSLGTDAGLTALQAAELAPLVIGVLTVLVIILAPAGLVGSLRPRLRPRRSRAATTTVAPTPSAGGSP